VHHPLNAEAAVELRAKTGGEEAVAEEAAQGVEDEYDELGFGNGEAMRPPEFRQPSDHGIDVLDVVDQAAVWMAKTIVDGRFVVVQLRLRDLLGFIALVLPIQFTQRLHELLLVATGQKEMILNFAIMFSLC
jgi:hypothetical protein